MNRGMYMRRGLGNRGIGNRGASLYGVMLLYQLVERMSAMDVKAPVTIALIITNLLIYALPQLRNFLPRELAFGRQFIARWTIPGRVCLNPERVLYHGERWRLLLSSFVHVSDVHVLYNCTSLFFKGVELEPRLGSEHFLALVLFLSVVAHVIYVAVAFVARATGVSEGLMRRCVVGFSGVLFGMKVVVRSRGRGGGGGVRVNRGGFGRVAVVARGSVWTELLFAQVLMPNVSFLGHLAGILAGFVYVKLERVLVRWVRNAR